MELPVFYTHNCRGWEGAVPVALLGTTEKSMKKKDLKISSLPCVKSFAKRRSEQ